jgi:uncharacterized protein
LNSAPPPLAGAEHAWPCLQSLPGGGACRLALAVVPNARRTGADGLHDGCLRVRLASPPVDGRANAQLLTWLADELHLPRRAVNLHRGDSARRKWVDIEAPAAHIAGWLATQVPAP